MEEKEICLEDKKRKVVKQGYDGAGNPDGLPLS
jgi:hypothetical protein